jgi:uncharacterized protein (TIGR03435 family)
MIFRIFSSGLTVFGLAVLPAQDVGGPPSFEVASVAPSAPPNGMPSMPSMRNSPGFVSYIGLPLKALLVIAYGVKPYQISGPPWMETERYDVRAKFPPDTPQDRIPVMMQGLLTERLGIKMHREQRYSSVLALVVGKSGPKFKESQSSTPDPVSGASGATSGTTVTLGPVRAPAALPQGAADVPPPAFVGAVPAPGSATRPVSPVFGGGHLQLKKANLSAFADMLSGLLSQPVIDQTKLLGTYDIELNYTADATMVKEVRLLSSSLPSRSNSG